jgi:hypothetical protein
LWEVFCALASGDGLRMTELDAWQRVHGVELSAWEVDTLIAMNNAASAAIQEQRAHGNPGR